MKCPTCKDITLVMTSRQDIEIDYCPECRGVWLDRGELDKLIEKSLAAHSAQTPPPQTPPQAQPPYPQHAPQDYYKKSKDSYHYKRKKSFLEEIFD